MKTFNIKLIQGELGVTETGVWDAATAAAFKNFQMRVGYPLKPTGEPDDESIDAFLKRANIAFTQDSDDQVADADIDDISATTDLSEYPIADHMLPPSEYCNSQVTKYEYIFLHHTSGWHNPTAVVDDWAADSRGRIGTQYVIGGRSISNQTDNHDDGKIIKCIPDGYWAYHLGSTTAHGINSYMHKNSIGIEICNFGWLQQKNGKFYTYTNNLVEPAFVTKLDKPFRGYQYWHSYTDKQINALYELLKYLGAKYNINLNNGLKQWINAGTDAFGYNINATAGKIKGILSHTNVRKDKTDVYPHPGLIQMLKSL